MADSPADLNARFQALLKQRQSGYLSVAEAKELQALHQAAVNARPDLPWEPAPVFVPFPIESPALTESPDLTRGQVVIDAALNRWEVHPDGRGNGEQLLKNGQPFGGITGYELFYVNHRVAFCGRDLAWVEVREDGAHPLASGTAFPPVLPPLDPVTPHPVDPPVTTNPQPTEPPVTQPQVDRWRLVNGTVYWNDQPVPGIVATRVVANFDGHPWIFGQRSEDSEDAWYRCEVTYGVVTLVKALLLKTPATLPTVPAGLIGPEHLRYLGRFNLPPTNAPAYDLNYNDGQLAHRYNRDGELRILTVGRPFEAGSSSDLIELAPAAIGGTATVTRNYGRVWPSLPIGDAGQIKLNALLWDDDIMGLGLRGLIFTYGSTYTQLNNPFLGVILFDIDDNIIGTYGPWGMKGVHSQFAKGYVVKLPADLVVLTGQHYWCGCWGTAQNSASAFGATAQTFNLPANFTSAPADTPTATVELTSGYTLVPGPNLDYHDISHRQYRSDDNFELCSWTYYNGSQYGDQDPRWAPNNPVQDGSGCNTTGDECGCYIAEKDGAGAHTLPNRFATLDTISAMAIASGPARRGLIMMGQLVKTFPGEDYPGGGTVHECYGPVNQPDGLTHKCPHGQHDTRYGFGTGNFVATMSNSMWFRDLGDYADVFNGIRANPRDLVEDYGMQNLASDGDPFPTLARGISPPYHGGATFVPASFAPWGYERYLLVHHPRQAPGGFGSEMTGQISVFAVDC